MLVAIGLKAHSGWAAAVVIGIAGNEFKLIDRRRIELVEPNDVSWAKQPYHAAEERNPADAGEIVSRGVQSAYRIAIRELQAEIEHLWTFGYEIAACAILSPMLCPNGRLLRS